MESVCLLRENLMDKEVTDRVNEIQQRIVQLRDSL